MDFEGAQYDESFILADVQVESALARGSRPSCFWATTACSASSPLGEDRWRIVANIPPESRGQTLARRYARGSAGFDRSARLAGHAG